MISEKHLLIARKQKLDERQQELHNLQSKVYEELEELKDALQVEVERVLLDEKWLSRFRWTATAPALANPGTFQIKADEPLGTGWNLAYNDLQRLCGGTASWLHAFTLGTDPEIDGQIQFMDGDLYIVAPTLQRGFEICRVHGLIVNWGYVETALSEQRRMLDEHVVALEYFKHLQSK